MKKEAATTRPIVIMKTDRVGYQASGTGLEIGFGALKKNQQNNLRNRKQRKRFRDRERLKEKKQKLQKEFEN